MDLNAPLGVRPPPPRRRLPLLLAAVAAAAALAGVVALLATADPHGGEPYAVATLPPLLTPPPLAPPPVVLPAAAPPLAPLSSASPSAASPSAASPSAAPADPTPTGSLAGAGPPGPTGTFDGGTLENGVRVYRGTGQAPAHGPLVIDVTRQLGAPPKDRGADRGGDHGSAPGSASGGASGDAPSAGLPRVAIYVAGMGPNRDATRLAVDAMPPAVTLAFVPYGADLPATVAAAAAKGHEVLLQLPMLDTGGSAPGPHALRPGEPAGALDDDLGWLLGRFDGYGGLANLLGAPVTADAAVMAGVLKAAAGRGLFFVEDGTSRRSLVLDVAARQHVPAVQADVVLDATADPQVVRANLDRLVEIARRKGAAIGMASGLPEHLPAIARYAAELSGKNISLVPVGALARGAPSVATITR